MHVQKYLHSYLDGELGADVSLEIEKHITDCARCRQQMEFEILFIDRVRSELRKNSPDTSELEEKIKQRLSLERKRRNETKTMKKIALIGLAASIVLGISIILQSSLSGKKELPPINYPEEIVKTHSHPMPLEISNANETEVAKWFEGKLDFPVTPPRFSPDENLKLVGARLSRFKEKDAAQLVYDLNGHKVTFIIFDPGNDAEKLEKQNVSRKDRRVVPLPKSNGWITTHRGYSVGFFTRRGIAYTMATDADEKDAMRLLSNISMSR